MKPTNAYRSVENILEREQRFRRTGRWPSWRIHDVKPGTMGADGWVAKMTRAAENGVFVVLSREVEVDGWGRVTHAMMRTASSATDISWVEKQRIKNELFGRERIAVEVFPRQSELVNGAHAYHLWVLPPGASLPVNLHQDEAA